jgi:pyruvate/2-oxoglutarate dehydrogenase complex dihydrolipoamide dehydrogenase (E3) component
MNKSVDAAIIGAGQAGPFLADRLARAGQSVALFERKLLGGTCVNTGCTPTKTMVASAKIAHSARDSARYGVHVSGDIRVSLAEVKARADVVVANSRKGLESLLAAPNITLYRSAARFISDHELQTGSDIIRAERIYINVGCRAHIPQLPGVNEVPFLTNTTLLQLEQTPEHLIIVGGGYIGLEFAQMFHRFGSEVTVLEMGPRLVGHEDEDVCVALSKLFEDEGIHVRLNAECIALSSDGNGVRVKADCTEGDPEVAGSHVLLAVGRTPNTNDLGLDAAGVHTDDRGYITVDDHLHTNVPHIFALGDCNRRGAFTHTSYNDFEIVAENLLDGRDRKVSDRIQAHALYVDPPLAQIGMTEAEVRKSGKKALMGTRDMTRVGRAVEKGETTGFMKVLVDAETKQILGASIFGVGGDEAIHCILDTMYAKAPYTTLKDAMHIHPTVAELIPTVLGDLKPLV